MSTSSGTKVVAPETIHDAKVSLMAHLWWHRRKGEWPTLTQAAQRDSWRGKEQVRRVRDYLMDNDYITMDGEVRVTPHGESWVEAPEVRPADRFNSMALAPPGASEESVQIVLFVENYRERRGVWPTITKMKDAGVRRRIGLDEFSTAFEALIVTDVLVRITLRRGGKWSTLVIPTRWCPWLRGRDGEIFWWDPSRGELPVD